MYLKFFIVFLIINLLCAFRPEVFCSLTSGHFSVAFYEFIFLFVCSLMTTGAGALVGISLGFSMNQEHCDKLVDRERELGKIEGYLLAIQNKQGNTD